ncbi:MAG: glycine zipper domain-containing protein [Planctomycetota bacterium]|nr:glycine zipper domain-containing protein [Planctomycetota bacterium]
MQHRTTSNWNTRRIGLGLVAGGSLVLASVAGGCNNAGEGALSGATLGALAGMGLGSLSGDMGKGAAAGAIIGGVGGAVLGDQNNRKDRRGSYRSNEW